MTTAYCVDVSGSMSTPQLKAAYSFVEQGIEPGDCIILFDCKAKLVDLKWFKDWINHPSPWGAFGCGGTDATECLALAKAQEVYCTTLIGDGYMIPEQLAAFNKFVDVAKLVTDG